MAPMTTPTAISRLRMTGREAWKAGWLPGPASLAGALGCRGYYIGIDNDSANLPDDGYELDVRNGGGTWDERDVVDAGFLELVRLGIRPADDPAIERWLQK